MNVDNLFKQAQKKSQKRILRFQALFFPVAWDFFLTLSVVATNTKCYQKTNKHTFKVVTPFPIACQDLRQFLIAF